MIELVIFDCDGVLVDSEMLAAQVMSDVLCSLGFPMSAEETLTAFVGLDADATRRKLENTFGKQLPADFDATVIEFLDVAFTTRLKALPGIEELISRLKQPFCVASNSGHDRLRRTFAATGLSHLFEGRVFSAQDVPRGKPEPDLFLHAAKVMGNIAPEHCLVIEDSVTGVTAAKAAGMRVIGFCGGAHIRPGHERRLLSIGADLIVATHRQIAASPLLAEAVTA